jgi:hypothetical protein
MPGVGPQGPGGNRVSLAFRFPGFPLEGSFFARRFLREDIAHQNFARQWGAGMPAAYGNYSQNNYYKKPLV